MGGQPTGGDDDGDCKASTTQQPSTIPEDTDAPFRMVHVSDEDADPKNWRVVFELNDTAFEYVDSGGKEMAHGVNRVQFARGLPKGVSGSLKLVKKLNNSNPIVLKVKVYNVFAEKTWPNGTRYGGGQNGPARTCNTHAPVPERPSALQRSPLCTCAHVCVCVCLCVFPAAPVGRVHAHMRARLQETRHTNLTVICSLPFS